MLLRADAEQHWLQREVLPVLRHLEAPEQLPEEQVGAALAYLEATWDEATTRASETDAAHSHLRARPEQNEALSGPAGRYHTAVRALRKIVARRVTPFVEPPIELGECDTATVNDGVRVKDTRSDGCAPRAA
ncbi:MAG TPA: hypothetical protein VGL79_02545 [Solirubrobacteraceae bacterium]